MKKQLLVLVFILLDVASSFSQQHGTIYTDAVWNITTKNRCYYYRKWQNEDSLIAIQDYHEDGSLFQKGHAKSLSMDLWRAREGEFTCYDPKGVKVSEGKFVHGRKEGKWKYYLSSSDIPYQEIVYKGGRMIYESVLNQDGKHKVSEVQYADGNEVMRKQYDSVGQLSYYAVLVNDQSIITNYYPSGKIKRVVTISNDSVLGDVNYGLNGEHIKNNDTTLADWGANSMMDSLPRPGYNIMEYIRNNIMFPGDLRFDTDERFDTTVAGLVTTRFMVMEDGSIRMAYTLPKGVSSLEEEVLRVLSNMPKWKYPAIKDKKNVKYLVTLPMNFNLRYYQRGSYNFLAEPSYRPRMHEYQYQNGNRMFTSYSYY